MDLNAVLVIFFGFAALFSVGIGPALWLIGRTSGNRVALALCIAPVVGLAETGFIFYPLILNDLSISQTAVPVTLVLIALSIALVYFDIRNHLRDYRHIASRNAFLFVALVFVVTLFFLLLPPLLGGRNTQFWQYSPWDAVSYMKMAEYAKYFPVSYTVLPDHYQEIIQFNPAFSALFSLNLMLARPAASNTLAWLSTLNNGISIYSGFYFLKILYVLLVYGVALAVCKKLNFSLQRSVACAVVLVVGFWAGLAINLDALSQLSSLSLSLLVLFAFLSLEINEATSLITRSRILAGLSLAAVMVFYPESVYLVAASVSFYYGLRLIYRKPSWQQRLLVLKEIAVIGLFTLLFQLPDLQATLNFFLRQAQTARGNLSWPTFYFDWLVDGVPFRDIWGLHFLQSSNQLLDLILGAGTFFIGLILTVYTFRGIKHAITQRKATLNDKLLVAFVVMFWSVGVVLLVFQQAWVAGKVLSWGYPFVIIALFMFAESTFRKARLFQFVFTFWLISQLLNPAFNAISYIWTNRYPLYSSQISYEAAAEIEPVLQALAAAPPASLGIDVSDLSAVNSPLATLWTFASGNVTNVTAISGDGGYTSGPPSYWQESDAVPDELLLTGKRDFLSALQLGEPLVNNLPYFMLSKVAPNELDQALMFPSILDPYAITAITLTDADAPFINDQGELVRWTRQRLGKVPNPEQTVLRFWTSGETELAFYLRYQPNFTGALDTNLNGSVILEQAFSDSNEQQAMFCVEKPGINTIDLNYRVEQLLELGEEDQRLLMQDALIARNGRLNVGALAEQLSVGEGWYAPEIWDTHHVRWAAENAQVMLLTCNAPSTLHFRAYAAPNEEETVELRLNGETLGTVALQTGWNEYSLSIPAGAYRPGHPQMLRLNHTGAIIPPNDTRAIAAAYEWFMLQ